MQTGLNTFPESEKYIIAACLSDPDAYFQAADYIQSPNVFWLEEFRIIWAAMQEMTAANFPIDPAGVANRIRTKTGAETHDKLISLALDSLGASNIIYHCQLVVERFISRRTVDIAGGAIEAAKDPTADIFETIDGLQTGLVELTSSLIQGRPVKCGDIIPDRITIAAARVERRREAEARGEEFTDGTPSGIADLDNILNGFLGGRFYTVAARPAMGKSAIVMNNFAIAAAKKGIPSLFKSMEMPKEELVDRIICGGAGIDYGKFQKGFLTESDFSAMEYAQKELSKLPIFIEDRGGDSVLKIRSAVRKYCREFGIKILYIDNLSLLRESGYNRENEISKITGGLKRLAIEMDIAIIAISHLNRKCDDRPIKSPMLSDLRDSGSIEQDSDGVLMVYRPWYYGQTYAIQAHQEIYTALIAAHLDADAIFKELAFIDVAKNRGLYTGDCIVRFIGKYTRFEQWTDPKIREIFGLPAMKSGNLRPIEPAQPVKYYEPKEEPETEFSDEIRNFPF